MGYEITRFIGEVGQEFLCHICKNVLENPVQIPCEHSFCYECIKSRITIVKTCPVDLIPITINGTVSVFKPPGMVFCNLLYKLNIRCDFQSIGCSKIMKLENLLDHKKRCEYNSKTELVCDKGCNLAVTRQDYLTNSCSVHLKQEILKLNHRVNFQRKRFEGLANCLYDRIKKLNDDVSRHSTQKLQLENIIRRQQQEITELNENRVSHTPLKWRTCHNMNVDESNNLKIDDFNSSTFAFVQSYYAVKPPKPHFQIQLSKSTDTSNAQRHLIWIGLTRKGHQIARNPEEESIAFICSGRIQVNEIRIDNNGLKWEDDDRIKLGLKFPKGFGSEGSNRATVCFHKNGNLLFEKRITVPHDGLFPTVCIYGRDTTATFICS